MRQFLYTGTQSRKIVRQYGQPKMMADVTPHLILEDTKNVWGEPEVSMGILLHHVPLTRLGGNGSLEPYEFFDGLPGIIDLVRGWRALALLEALPCVDDHFFFLDMHIATDRDPKMSTYHQQIRDEIRNEFEDPSIFDEIMARPVPLSLLQHVIQLSDAGVQEVILRSITDEIECGTVRWSQELKRIGVEHPDYRRAIRAAKDRIVAQYTDYLFSYATYSKHPYAHNHEEKSFIMLVIEWHLVKCIERGIENTYGISVAAMLAILTAEIECDDAQEKVESEHPSEWEGGKPFTRPTPLQAIDDILTWFFTCLRSDSRSEVPQRESCKELLQQLLRKWNQLPITHPVVD